MPGTFNRHRTKLAWLVGASIVFVLTFSLANSSVVEAHANQIQSSPSPSEELEQPPERVIIWFTEPIEPLFSSISVLNRTGAEMTVDETVLDPTEPQAMWAPLGELENGTYTVVWRNVSTVDGHKVFGSYLFSVGQPIDAGSSTSSLDQPLLQAKTDPLIRWLIYVGIAVLFGGLIFELLILSPALIQMHDDARAAEAVRNIGNSFFAIAVAALALVLLAQLAQLTQQALILYDIEWISLKPSQMVNVTTQSDWGRYWSFRFAFGIVAAFSIFMAQRARVPFGSASEPENPPEIDDEQPTLLIDSLWGIIALGSASVYLALISFSSHNAATPEDVRWIALSSDIVHIVVASLWVGGLLYLLISATAFASTPSSVERRSPLAHLVSRFTPLALLAAAALVASGIVSSLMQVTIPQALATPYGYTLITKIVLAISLLAIAAYNMLSVSRRLSIQREAAARLRRTVMAESAIAILALLAAAWMASLEPARQYAERNGIGIDESVSQTIEIDGATAHVSIDPGEVGPNTLSVELRDRDGDPFDRTEEVRARVKFLNQDFGEPYLPIDQVSGGVWRQENLQIGVAGAYQVEVSITRSDAFDSRVAFRFSARSTSVASDLIRPEPRAAHLLLGIQIMIVGVALFASGLVRLNPFTINPSQYLASSRNFAIFGAIFVVVGGLVSINVLTIGAGMPQGEMRNPFPLNQDSIALGELSYVSTCATCHGDDGRGDGPAGAGLNPSPSDLAVHVPLHSDVDLFDFISNGIEGTAMAPQSENLTAEEIWHLVNFIRTFEE